MQYFLIGMGILIGLLFLLAVLTDPAQAGNAVPASSKVAQPADGTPLVCLALASGTGLLAGIVWLGTLQRIPEEI